MSGQKLPFLKIGPIHNMVNEQGRRRPPTRWYRVVEFDGHWFIHYKISDWPDGEAPSIEQAILLNQEVDYMTNMEPKRTDLREEDVTRICVHCNGGLGRAPTFVCLRTLWNAAKLAHQRNIPRVCKWHHQELAAPVCRFSSESEEEEKETKVESEPPMHALNLASVLRNIIVRGYYTRSCFVQTEMQNAILQPFAEAMVKHSFIDEAKHTA